MDNIIQNTGELFGNLFAAFDQENFLRSVSLFEKRFRENEFDVSFFQGKKCLDLGCGGGRYSIATSILTQWQTGNWRK
jgi:2-polyprenyl-3-methyl-5-hydroxy-6-metoxy-1,4-benzoquinol methylase